MIGDGRVRLDQVIAELDALDPAWAVFGNAGGLPNGTIARRISDRWGQDDGRGGQFPLRAVNLDENFMVARRDANLALSGDLGGYYLYGTDLVLIC